MGKNCCTAGNSEVSANKEYETAQIETTNNICPMCEDFAVRNQSTPVVVMSCEGACLRGEVSRIAANLVCHELAPEKTVRICLGGAFTKNTGQRNLVKNAQRLIALEGCHINCASRMMRGVIRNLTPEVIIADQLYEFDRSLFGINQMAPEQIREHANTVAQKIVNIL
jgi:uncharacterized metal-binding protein